MIERHSPTKHDGMDELLAGCLKPTIEDVLLVVRCIVILVVSYVSFVSTKWLLNLARALMNMFEPMNYELVSGNKSSGFRSTSSQMR
jgi:hypothetical protein